ncbi:MAG: DegT/DnrJ/EryC1/StrS family aminotransferase [Spirochaetales bacterium]|jgi:dTDP-4-amino-4,6-dideoxygalactose transaminase|nr:DegT/DnrJ/EryC1/StrS family aminotransferase [Spirochaetales bacterium]
MTIKFLDLHSQYLSIKNQIDDAIKSVISETAFIGGKYVKQFENEFAEFQKSKFCVGVANGTDALEIAIEALSLPKKSEIIVPGNSFIASSEAVTRCGHRVVFADVDSECYTINAETIRPKITSATAAIVAVHLYGHPCDMDSILEIAAEFQLRVIEDCAQAHGAVYKGRRVGTIGDIGTFSFYPGKNLGAYGDAGAIVTNDESLSIICRKIANHGRIAKYDHDLEGRNSRMDALQAAILSVKLPHLEGWTKKRVDIADYYFESLQNVPDLILPVRKTWAHQVYHLFVIRSNKRDPLKNYLAKQGIETGIHYPVALPKLAAYAYLNQANEESFVNESDATLLSLPIGEHLTISDMEYVTSAIKTF